MDDDPRRDPPELGSEEARERIRRSGHPLDEWRHPGSRDARRQADRDDRDGRIVVAVLFALLIAAVIAFAVFGWGSTDSEGDVCQDDRGAYIC